MKYHILTFAILLILATGCKKTEQFYDQLDSLPRADMLRNNAYAVGDTLVLTGKFGAGITPVAITVGGIDAPVISLVTHDSMYVEDEVHYNYTSDKVKMLITEPMIGLQQPVVATVNHVSSTVGIIMVTKDRPIAVRADTLCYLDTTQARVALALPNGARVVPNYTPGAPITFVSGDSIISWQGGAIRRGKINWADNNGSFSVVDPGNTNYGFASDPTGMNLYISCLTRDAQLPDATYIAIRLVRISLQDYTLTTLNRTVVPVGLTIDATKLDFDTVKREGNISEVCFPLVKNLYVNKAGDIYFSQPSFNWTINSSGIAGSAMARQNLTIGRIDASGVVQYLAKANATSAGPRSFRVPYRKNGIFNSTYDFIPNVSTTLDYTKLMAIDAENGLLYGYTGISRNSDLFFVTTFYCYNLTQQRQLSEFTYKLSDDRATVTVGPFDIVEGRYEDLATKFPFQWLSPGQPMVIFGMQRSRRLDGLPPTVNIINFTNRTVTPYATYLYNGTGIYRNAIGGQVIGYTAAQNPIMVLTKTMDPTINEVQLLTPIE